MSSRIPIEKLPSPMLIEAYFLSVSHVAERKVTKRSYSTAIAREQTIRAELLRRLESKP